MYWSASATLWTRSSCLIVVIGKKEGARAKTRPNSIICASAGGASSLENEQQVSEEEQQMDGAEQDVRPAARERQGAEHERERKKDDVLRLEAEHDALAGDEADGEHGRNREADGG